MVDGALMRPGRFDKICYCGLPSPEEKLEICEVLARKHGLTLPEGTLLQDELRQLVSQLPRLFTCADLGALFSSAKIESVTAAMSAASGDKEGELAMPANMPKPVLTMDHIYSALPSAKPSVSEADERRYEKIFENYKPGVKSAMAPKENAAPERQRVALA